MITRVFHEAVTRNENTITMWHKLNWCHFSANLNAVFHQIDNFIMFTDKMSTFSDIYRRFPIFSAVNYSSELAEVLLSDEDDAENCKKPSAGWEHQHWHWVFHSISVLLILYLGSVILGLNSGQKLTYLECWERSHTYCKRYHVPKYLKLTEKNSV